ncbi:hypothetical protein [Nocardia carnea]|uniref:hypothetical protein n=1 Tax=Nocardia carnea TaxID=37328 RepID=UPI003D789D54
MATDLGSAQHLLQPALSSHRWFRPILDAPTTPSVTIQFELDQPCAEVDRTTFGPGTILASYSEQSGTTFPHAAPGRLSVILQSPQQFLDKTDDAIAGPSSLRRRGWVSTWTATSGATASTVYENQRFPKFFLPHIEARGTYWTIQASEPPEHAGIGRCFDSMARAIARRGAIATDVCPLAPT